MVKYIIMSFMAGFTGNKLFNKKDKSTNTSVQWGCIVGTVALVVREVISRL